METATNNGQQMFCYSLGSTLGILQYFTQARARLLLSTLSKFTRQFYQKQENNVFRSCIPTVFSARIKHRKTIKGGEDRFIVKVLHLRDDLFVIGYASNEIVIKNLENGETVDQIQIENEEQPLADLDIYNHSEMHILAGYRGDHCYLINFKTRSVNQFQHYLPQPLSLLQYLQHFPGHNFVTVSKGGVYRIWDSGLVPREIAKFHPLQYITEIHRPFQIFVELENNQQNSLGYEGNGVPQTMMAFVLQGKNMQHRVCLYNYFGLNSEKNSYQAISIEGQLIHCLKQMQTSYLAVSTDKELRIYDILNQNLIRSINTNQPMQFLIRVNPKEFNFELGMIGEACIGYSYKTFYECGVSIGPGPHMQEFQFQVLRELEEQRKRKIFELKEKPNAIISYCQVERGNQNYLIVSPREEQDTIIIFKVSLQ